MSILKLANLGDEATLAITRCAVVDGQYGEQVVFSDGDDDLYLPRTSADRQLERLGIGYDQAVGEKLTFSRAPNNKPGSKPFWNIAIAGNGKPPIAKATLKAPVASTPKSFANKPNSELPPLLQNAEAEDNAELAAKVGVDLAGIQNTLALYQGIAEWASRELPPIFAKGKDAVGMTPESLAACANTIFINTAGKK